MQEPRRPKESRIRKRLRLYIDKLLPKKIQPSRVAISVAVGVFIGVLPLWGLALPITAGLLVLIKKPVIPGLMSSFIATPPTQFGIFYPLAYWLGRAMLSPAPLDRNFLEVVANTSLDNLGSNASWFWNAGRDHLFAFVIGLILVDLFLAILCGFLSFYFMRKRYQQP